MEAKWKRNNPLPLAETIIYKGILSILVEVEANLHKIFRMKYHRQLRTPSFVPFRGYFVATLEHDSDGCNDVVEVFIGGIGFDAIRLSHILETDLAVDAYAEMPANLVLDAGL